MQPDHDHENEITYFARTNFRGEKRKFGIKTDDRRRHVYIIGKTGMGKTTLLENMILSDVYAGHGVCYIDPHGDPSEKMLDYIPTWRINDVIYFNPADINYPMGFNILETVDEAHKHLVAAGLMSVFKKIWENMWSARMEYILNNTILALLDYPDSTLLGINRMLSDADYRKRVVMQTQDPIVQQFWLTEFASYNEKYAVEAVAPIQNKIGQFLSASIIRNMVAQVKSTINIRTMMDEGKIFMVNLSKGRIGEDNMRLLGGMLITKLQMSAMERVEVPEEDRRDFYVYVDEFQNFANPSFADILSEARKYRLNLTVAHQYIAQLDETVRDGVFGNVGTILTFRVGAPDAVSLAEEFIPKFTEEDLINLTKFEIYLKLMIDGVASMPFSAMTLPPIAQRTGSTDKVIKVSRERYTRPKKEIEEKILQWSGFGEDVDVEKILEAAEEKKTGKKKKKTYPYDCSRCSKVFEIPVVLDKSRSIFCEDCKSIVDDEKAKGVNIIQKYPAIVKPEEGAGDDKSPADKSDQKPPDSKGDEHKKDTRPPQDKKSPERTEQKDTKDARPPQDRKPVEQKRQPEQKISGGQIVEKKKDDAKSDISLSVLSNDRPAKKQDSRPPRGRSDNNQGGRRDDRNKKQQFPPRPQRDSNQKLGQPFGGRPRISKEENLKEENNKSIGGSKSEKQSPPKSRPQKVDQPRQQQPPQVKSSSEKPQQQPHKPKPAPVEQKPKQTQPAPQPKNPEKKVETKQIQSQPEKVQLAPPPPVIVAQDEKPRTTKMVPPGQIVKFD